MKADDLFVQTINDEDLELPPPEKKYVIRQLCNISSVVYSTAIHRLKRRRLKRKFSD